MLVYLLEKKFVRRSSDRPCDGRCSTTSSCRFETLLFELLDARGLVMKGSNSTVWSQIKLGTDFKLPNIYVFLIIEAQHLMDDTAGEGLPQKLLSPSTSPPPLNLSLSLYIYIHINICIYTYIYIYTNIYMFLYIYIYTYMYIYLGHRG